MSIRNISDEILSLVALINAEGGGGRHRIDPLTVDDVEPFAALATGVLSETGIEFVVPPGKCAVVVALEEFNADLSAANTVTVTAEGKVISVAQPTAWRLGGDVFYVFPPGASGFTFASTPVGGLTHYARAVGYFLPVSTLQRLSRLSTRIIG